MTLAMALRVLPSQAQGQPFQPDPEAIGRMFSCMRDGLTGKWQRAWVVVTEVARTESEREVSGKFFYAESAKDTVGKPLIPCDSERVARDLYNLNTDLIRQYREASLVFYPDGKFDLRYDSPK